jgi:hypothetical protein
MDAETSDGKKMRRPYDAVCVCVEGMVFETWDLNFGGWEILGYGFQDMVFGTWDLNFGAWIFTLAVSKIET